MAKPTKWWTPKRTETRQVNGGTMVLHFFEDDTPAVRH